MVTKGKEIANALKKATSTVCLQHTLMESYNLDEIFNKQHLAIQRTFHDTYPFKAETMSSVSSIISILKVTFIFSGKIKISR